MVIATFKLLVSVLPTNGQAKTCTLIAGVIGSWTLSGVLSVLASAVTIVVGGMQIYDWMKARKGK